MKIWRTPLAKVVLLFLVGIIVPTGFLVYLGIHSVRAETILLRKQAEERMQEASGAMQSHMEEAIRAVLKPYADFMQQRSRFVGELGPSDFSLLRDLQRQQNAERLILLDSQERVRYPMTDLPPVRDAALPDLADPILAQLRAAQTEEFQRKAYPEALAGYQALAASIKDPRWKATLLTRIAGCLSKAHQEDHAQTIYRQIIADYGQELNENGDPFGLAIAWQLSESLQNARREAAAAALEQQTLQALLTPRWVLPWQTEQFYGDRLAARLETRAAVLSGHPKRLAEQVLEDWRRRRTEVEKVRDFTRQLWTGWRSQLASMHRLNQPTLLCPTENNRLLIYSPLIDTGTAQRRFSLVALAPQDSLLALWQRALQPLASASQLNFRVQNEKGRSLIQSSPKAPGRWVWERPLDGVLPRLMLQFSEVRDFPVERAAAQRQRIYMAMVALAASVIVVALYTVWYAVRREMEVAQLKAGFVANISHELKTPLSIISLVGQTLQLKRYQSSEEADNYYGMLSEETTRLKGLIDEVLDFSRLMDNRKPYHPKPTDLDAVVRTALDRCIRSSAPRKVEATFSSAQAPFPAWVDPEALERVVLNLVDNAIKYSPPERTRVNISLRRTEDACVLEVSDQGYGIPEEEKGLVFERFFRGQSATDHQYTQGVGLGLSMVRHIVEAHGGTVSVRRHEAQGSVFTVLLPLKEIP